MRMTLTWALLLLVAGCGGPTWYGLTRQVADADQRLEAGDPVGAAARYRAAGDALDIWLESKEGRALRAALDAGRAPHRRWTLVDFRARALPRARLWGRAHADRLATAFLAARGVAPGAPRAIAHLDVARDLAAAGRAEDAAIVLDAAEEAVEDLGARPHAALLLPRLVELACVLDDDALLTHALEQVEATADMDLGEAAVRQLHVGTAQALARRGRCEGLGAQVGRLADALEARWRDPDPCGVISAEDVPPPWSAEIFGLLLELSRACLASDDVDGALTLLDDAVPWAEADGDEALRELGAAYIEAGLPGEAAALAGSVDDPVLRDELLVAAATAWTPGAGPSGPVREDVILWLEAAEAAAMKAPSPATRRAFLLEIAARWEILGEMERAAAARAQATDLNLQLDR